MDRHCTSLAAHLLRRPVWSIVRLRLLSRHADCGQLLGRVRHYDAQLEHPVLAGLLESGDMYGPWSGTVVYPKSRAGGDLVRQEAGHCIGYRHEWDRRR